MVFVYLSTCANECFWGIDAQQVQYTTHRSSVLGTGRLKFDEMCTPSKIRNFDIVELLHSAPQLAHGLQSIVYIIYIRDILIMLDAD